MSEWYWLPGAGRRIRRGIGSSLVLAALPLAGCSLSNGASTFLLDPGHYEAYHCTDLKKRWADLVKRQNNLQSLMDLANGGAGGAVIGTLAYRSDYETVLGEENLVKRAAAEKNCDLGSNLQSDHTIR